MLADAGYWKNEAIEALCGQGIQTLVAPDADRRKEPRPGRRGGLYDFTRRVLATDWGTELYLQRQGTVEPVFGQIKANRGANRFLRRGRSAVRSEWRLLAATHNLLKLHRHRIAESRSPTRWALRHAVVALLSCIPAALRAPEVVDDFPVRFDVRSKMSTWSPSGPASKERGRQG